MISSGFQIESSELCDSELKSDFQSFISQYHVILSLSGCYEQLVESWLKIWILRSQVLNSDQWSSEDKDLILFLDERDINVLDITAEHNKLYIKNINLMLHRWSHREWGHKLESIYLENKDGLDCVSFQMLRNRDKYLAAEIYYRLTAGEQSFQQLSWEFGEGSERNHAGQFVDQRLNALPKGLPEFLRQMKPGEVAKPRLYGNFYTILMLNKFTQAQFDDDMKDFLVVKQLSGLLAAIRRNLTSVL